MGRKAHACYFTITVLNSRYCSLGLLLYVRLKFSHCNDVAAYKIRLILYLPEVTVKELEKAPACVFVCQISIKFSCCHTGLQGVFYVGKTHMLHVAEKHFVSGLCVIDVTLGDDVLIVFA